MSELMLKELETISVNSGEDVVVATLETTGQRIYWLRRYTLKMKQKDFAVQIGTSQGFLSEIESDKKEAGSRLLARIAELLHTTTDYLLLRTDNPSPPDDDKPTYLYPEAEQVACMMDEIAYPELRNQAVQLVKGIHDLYEEHARRDKQISDLLGLIESTRGTEFRRDLEKRLGLIARAQGTHESLSF